MGESVIGTFQGGDCQGLDKSSKDHFLRFLSVHGGSSEFLAQGLGLRADGFRCRVSGSGFNVVGSRFRVAVLCASGFQFRTEGLGLEDWVCSP